MKTLAIPGRLELPTYGLGNRRSIRLSYGTADLYGKTGAWALHSKASPVSPALRSDPSCGATEFWPSRKCPDRRTAHFGRSASVGAAREGNDRRHAGNGLDVSAYRCVGVAARNRQNNCVHRSPLRPVVTRHELTVQRRRRDYVSARKRIPSLRALTSRPQSHQALSVSSFRSASANFIRLVEEHSLEGSVLEGPINLSRRIQCRNF